MNNAQKVVLNTGVLYLKIIISTLISLVSVPLILKALGESDYGIYSLVAGVVGFLAFLKSAMMVSTQRFLSVSLGEGNLDKIIFLYNTTLVLHLFLGLFIILILESCIPFLFDGFLNIPDDRVSSAKVIYQLLVVSTFVEILSVPFMAVINAKEDMFVFSIIGITESLLKLCLAFYIGITETDRLIVYGLGMFMIAVLSIISNIVFVCWKYKELKLNCYKYFSLSVFRKLFEFTIWNTFGALAIIGRNQGVSIVMNIFYGTLVNAAYGIANQVNSVLSYFSVTLQKSINPQLMKSYGMGNSERLVNLSYLSSKFSTLAMIMFAIPMAIEMECILSLWLPHVPNYTLQFCRLVLVMSVLTQFSMGLMSAISATGKIRNYQIIISCVILLNVPISYLLMKYGLPPFACIIGFIVIEIISFLIRLCVAHRLVGIGCIDFLYKVTFPTTLSIIIPFLTVSPILYLMELGILRLVILFFVYYVCFAITTWFLVLNKREKEIICELKDNMYRKFITRI